MKKIFLLFSTIFFLYSNALIANETHSLDGQLEALARSENVFVRKALELKNEVDNANKQDLIYLWDVLNHHLGLLSDTGKQDFISKTIVKLRSDKEKFIELKTLLDRKTGIDRGSLELRTSLAKLLGTPQYSGILDDAIEWLSAPLESNPLFIDPRMVELKGNKITVVKTLLLYANMIVTSKQNLTDVIKNLKNDVQMLYPADVPTHVDPKFLEGVGLSCSVNDVYRMMIPNAGFIFGGNFKDGVCKGIDCSAFLSYCTESSIRLSTMFMEFMWREQIHGPESFTADEKKTRDELWEKWDMKTAMDEYQAIDLNTAATLSQGDLIVWRWNDPTTKARSGHVVMYLIMMNEDAKEFLGIEDNRQDDKSKEGIVVDTFNLYKDNADTYVLRRRRP